MDWNRARLTKGKSGLNGTLFIIIYTMRKFMYAVIFEVKPIEAGKAEYLKFAASLRKSLENRPGFISIERFQSLVEEKKILSLSFWENEASIEAWRNAMDHRIAQRRGKDTLFESYRIRVARVIRDYTDTNRDNAPEDSNAALL